MKDVLNYIRNICFDMESHVKLAREELFFSMNSYNIVIKLKDGYFDQFDIEDYCADIDSVDLSEITALMIDSIRFQYGSFLFIEEGQEVIEHRNSYTYIANKLSAYVESKFKGAIEKMEIGPYCVDDTCSMCDDVWAYGFVIFIHKDYWDSLDLFQLLNRYIKTYSGSSLPSFYLGGENLSDNYEVSVLPSNTKIRRLGYLKLLLKMVNDRKKISISQINRQFERYVQSYNVFLSLYKNDKGIVLETKTGNSSKPYVELAESIGLIRKTATYYEIGKMGKVYIRLKQSVDEEENNPFVLSDFDVSFFYEQLLKKDFLYLYVLMEIVCQTGGTNYSSIKRVFQDRLLFRINRLVDGAREADSQKILNLKKIEKRIMSWEKPNTYLEHVLMPRINWLYDLGIIDYDSNKMFSLTPKGDGYFYNLSIWNDLNMCLITNPIDYINSYYFRIVDFCSIPKAKLYQSENCLVLQQCINDCFNYFTTIAPNRTTFSLVANYCKYLLYWQHSIIIDINDIKSLFESDLSVYYIYKYQAQYKDGYIQKRNKT
ncbi:MAG: hypothetical protein IKX35_08410 [Bacteroidales bacterium]|nr:hypothetical protein [Bacteroidales bacterium]